MPNPENLIPYRWPKGTSGNIKGKPKGAQSFKKVIEDLLTREIEIDDPFHQDKNTPPERITLTLREMIALKLVGKCIKNSGDLFAIRELLDRLEGRPAEQGDGKKESELQSLSVKVYNIVNSGKPRESTGEAEEESAPTETKPSRDLEVF